MMGGGGGLLWWVIVCVLLVVPFWRLLPQFGIPKYFALLAVLPLVAIILLWVIAFRDKLDGDIR